MFSKIKIAAEAAKRGANAAKLALKAKSPTIALVVGFGAMGASIVIACKKTLTVNEKINDEMETLEKMKETYNDTICLIENSDKPDDVKEADIKRANKSLRKGTFAIYTKLSGKILRHYAPAIITFALGVVAISWSHMELSKRLSTAVTGLAALSTQFNEYREYIRKNQGEDVDTAAFTNGKVKKIVKETVNDDGVVTKEEVNSISKEDFHDMKKNPFIYVLDKTTCSVYDPRPGVMDAWIASTESDMTRNLRGYGYRFIEDFLYALHMESQVDEFAHNNGWSYHYNDEKNADNYVSARAKAFYVTEHDDCGHVINAEPVWILNFNSEGDIRNRVFHTKKRVSKEICEMAH